MPPKSASKAVSTTAAAEPTINCKRDAENVVQNTEVDNKKQKIVNGDVAHDFEKKLVEEKEEVKEVDSESEDSDSEDATPATWTATPNNNDADDDDEDDSSEEDDEADNNATDAEMVDTPAANKESHNLTSGSTTLFMGNLSFSIKESQVVDFFKDAGEVVEIRLAMRDGLFTGYGHVEFATLEAAQEALKLNGELLLQRAVRLELARERDRSSQKSGQSSQKSGTSETLTVFVKGFGTDDDVDDIKYCLKQHFGECGEISRVTVPKDFESGAPKGVAFIDFTDSVGFSKALQLSGSEVNGGTIVVDVAKQSGGDGGSGRGRGGGRGRFGGRDGGGRGRFGGRDGGRGGDRGRSRGRGRGKDRGRGRH